MTGPRRISLPEHTVEIVSDAGEGAQKAAIAFAQLCAKAGNGLYKRLDEPSAIAHICTRLESLEGIQVGTYVYTDYGQRFQWPLLLAILLLAAEALIAEQRAIPRERGRYAQQ